MVDFIARNEEVCSRRGYALLDRLRSRSRHRKRGALCGVGEWDMEFGVRGEGFRV